jgi:hypothetical protein
MYKKIWLFCCLFSFFGFTFGQSHQTLYIGIHPDVPFSSDVNFVETLKQIHPLWIEITRQYPIELSKATYISETQLQYLSTQSIKLNGNDDAVKRLRNTFKIESDLSDSDWSKLSEALKKLPEVTFCSLQANTPIPPPSDINPTTPDFTIYQTYLGSNPGVNMTYAWNLGYSGQNIRIRDVEYGFNKNHEEFNDINIQLAPGTTINPGCSSDYTEHGTAANGVLFAQNTGYGVKGLAHNASEVRLFPEWTVEYNYNRNYAVSQAINSSLAGDIILLEMQAYGATGSGNDFVPAEYDIVLWNIVKAATDAGIVIVAAAGNGNQNLDGSLYTAYMSRGNSGAIVVGAGTSNTDHNREGYSSYGSRVDVQGWGNNVYTSGYTTLSSLGNDFNQTYTYFSGTSSASAVVAGCVTVIQSYYHEQTGNFLTGAEINQILKSTGIPQGTGVSGQIGPLPNMEVALLYLDSIIGLSETESTTFTLYPNPATDRIHIHFNQVNALPYQVEIFNTLGQCVHQMQSQNTIDVSHLSKGIYTVKITGAREVWTEKIILK